MGVLMINGSSIFSSVEEATAQIARGGIVIVVDDADRENEGDFIMAASCATPESVNFLAAEGRGLICAALEENRARALDLRVQGRSDEGPAPLHGTAFTESIDYVRGTTTGISASDRSATFMALADPTSRVDDFARPGHVFPLVARNGGVIARRGHTETTVDLCRLAGLEPVGVLCEILNPDGSMARLPQLRELACRFDMPLVSVEQLTIWRKKHECLINPGETVSFPTRNGDFELIMFDSIGEVFPLSLRRPEAATVRDGSPTDRKVALPLVRVHSECFTGDVFGSSRCDCGPQLDAAMEMIGKESRGAVIYLRQEGRGIGLKAKLRAYKLQEGGLDTWDANTAQGLPPDDRDYWEAAQIIKLFGWREIRLLTNNPTKVEALELYGIHVAEIVPLRVGVNPHNRAYLETKRKRFGHLFESVPADVC